MRGVTRRRVQSRRPLAAQVSTWTGKADGKAQPTCTSTKECDIGFLHVKNKA